MCQKTDLILAAVDRAADTENGFLDTKLRDLETAFGTRLTLEKKDRLRAYDTSMTQWVAHARVDVQSFGSTLTTFVQRNDDYRCAHRPAH